MEGPAVPSFFVDLSNYRDASRDPRGLFYNLCPPFIVDKIDEEAIDIEKLKMQVLLHNLVQRGFVNVSAAESAARENA
jgi:hypothetical protein